MIYTKTQAVTILTKRLSRLLASANLTGEQFDHQLTYAACLLGGTVSNPLSVVDADLATVAADRGELMLDIAELNTWDIAGFAILAGSDQAGRVAELRQTTAAGLARFGLVDQLSTGVIDLQQAEFI